MDHNSYDLLSPTVDLGEMYIQTAEKGIYKNHPACYQMVFIYLVNEIYQKIACLFRY